MTSEEIGQEAEEHCNEVMCSVCENKTCTERRIKCREWRDRRAGYYCGAELREKRIEELENKIADIKANCDLAIEGRDIKIMELEKENERIKTKYYEFQETLKKIRLALIKERTANIMNYGKGGFEMFNDCFEILKGVSN